jgi:hypothetical protein
LVTKKRSKHKKTDETTEESELSSSEVETESSKHIDMTLGIALNLAVNDGKLHAMTVSPNLINFDPSKAARGVDYRKTVECRDPPKIYSPEKYTKNNTAFFWFIFIVLTIILLICVLSYTINYALPNVENYNSTLKVQNDGETDKMVLNDLQVSEFSGIQAVKTS